MYVYFKHEKSKKVLKVSTSKLTVRSTKEFSCNIDGEELKDKDGYVRFWEELLKKN